MSALYAALLEQYEQAPRCFGRNAAGDELIPHPACAHCGRAYVDVEWVGLCAECRRLGA